MIRHSRCSEFILQRIHKETLYGLSCTILQYVTSPLLDENLTPGPWVESLVDFALASSRAADPIKLHSFKTCS